MTNTITAHGKTYKFHEANARLIELANLTAQFGESDGRVTEANAIREALAGLRAEATTAKRATRVDYQCVVFAETPKGVMRKFTYKDGESMEAGLDRLITKGYSIHSYA